VHLETDSSRLHQV